VSAQWQARIDAEGEWQKCHEVPDLAFTPEEMRWIDPPAGKDICVLGSGNNLAAFALAGMGARVTSVDFSRAQLNSAALRAERLGLHMRFVQADVTDLSTIPDGSFDLVYTGGHVAVWVSDLKRYYREAARILRPGGLLIVSEYHPFRRTWKQSPDRLEIESPYLDRGPWEYDRSGQADGAQPGSLPSYEFNWTISDYVNAMLEANCQIIRMEEFGSGREAWETAPVDGLPLVMLLVGRK
jgi:SAM-dependent methyltransferase